MKLNRLTIQNFLGVRAVDVDLSTARAHLFCGSNYAGKSSLQEAVRLALTGESVRVEHKKDYGALVTDDAGKGSIVLEWDKGVAAVGLPEGQRNLSGSENMPAFLTHVLDAPRFARMTETDRRAFLFSLMGLKVGSDDVRARLLKRGCDDKRVESVLPMLRAGFDAASDHAKGAAREAKGAWRSVTGETYGEKKAEGWKAEQPAGAGADTTDLDAKIKATREAIDAENQALGAIKAKRDAANQRAAKIEQLREQSGKYARIHDKLNNDQAERDKTFAKVQELRARAGQPVAAETTYACPCCSAVLVMREGKLAEYVKPNASGDLEAIAQLPAQEQALAMLERAIENDKRDLAAADAAGEQLKVLEDEQDDCALDSAEYASRQAKVNELQAALKEQAAARDKIAEVQRAAQAAEKKTADAAKHHADVQAWDAIAVALSPNGIPAEILAEALQPINARLKDSAALAEWSVATIGTDMAITYSGRAYPLLSESEKWRVDAMVAEAVSYIAGLKLLVLDRMDVLDGRGREDALLWLDGLVSSGSIETALVFATLKSIPSGLPETIQGHWLEAGRLPQQNLQQAA